jgi:hypothetical protein
MMEWLKAFYGAVGANYPLLSLIIVAVIGAIASGAVWWVVGEQYQKDHPAKSVETKREVALRPALTNSPSPEAPYGAIAVITPAQRRALKGVFAGLLLVKPQLLLVHIVSDAKAQALAADIANVAMESGMSVELRSCLERMPDGVSLAPPSLELMSESTMVAKALTEARISFNWTERRDLPCLPLLDNGKVVLSVGVLSKASTAVPTATSASTPLPDR